MEVDSENCLETGTGDGIKAENEVTNDPPALGRHQHPVLLPSGIDMKLAVKERAQDESSAGTRTPDLELDQLDTPDMARERDPDRERDKDKGRKRRKYRRARPNKKVWRKELAEAAGAGPGAGPAGREGIGAVSPTLLGRIRSLRSLRANAALPAPNNTTQFIMEDHTDLQDLDLEKQCGSRTTRVRDSSFSIDSDEDLSSSPEDEAYLSKEFSNTYEDVHVERLGTMTKLDLIQEYLQLEERVDVLEKKLKTAKNTSSGTCDSGGNGGTGTDSDSEVAEGEMPMEPAVAEKIRIFQEEIQKLVVENQQLLQENQRLQSSSSLVRPSSSSLSSSIDSESDSSTSSGSSSSSSSSQRSRASRSSRSSGTNMRTSTELPPEDKMSDVEMANVEQCDKSPLSHTADQDMESEITSTVLSPKESPHHDGSVISSVAAH